MPFLIQWVDNIAGATDCIGLDTPGGKLVLSMRQDVIVAADWLQSQSSEPSNECLLQQQLTQYWADPGLNIPVKLLKQGSLYRHQVWAGLCQIPIGETMSYSALAKKIASAARAVGNACRDNPYPLFIPCHRVVAASGMGGYCGHTEGHFMMIKHSLLAWEAKFKGDL